MSYSFGPSEQSAKPFEDARNFGARGRRVLRLFGVIDSGGVQSALSMSRFFVNHFALGGYASGGLLFDGFTRNFVGGGLEALGDLPLGASVSLLAAPRLGYRLTRFDAWSEEDGDLSHEQERRAVAVHQLQLALPVYLALHLRDGLILGFGPELAYDRQLALSPAVVMPNENYLRLGVASAIMGSF